MNTGSISNAPTERLKLAPLHLSPDSRHKNILSLSQSGQSLFYFQDLVDLLYSFPASYPTWQAPVRLSKLVGALISEAESSRAAFSHALTMRGWLPPPRFRAPCEQRSKKTKDSPETAPAHCELGLVSGSCRNPQEQVFKNSCYLFSFVHNPRSKANF